MLKNWLRLGNTIINLDNVAHIVKKAKEADKIYFDINFIDRQVREFATDTAEGKAIEYWLQSSVPRYLSAGTGGTPIDKGKCKRQDTARCKGLPDRVLAGLVWYHISMNTKISNFFSCSM
jgi:glycosidase